ncbi:MAG: acyl-CoA synthetase [Caulobacteraceae bacterium]|jgi:acyl-CoA synthetase (AMP-forming)/AMP-acid ligase II|nr:acyl-CoA synthetase [Caulobacteraceae bacterium]
MAGWTYADLWEAVAEAIPARPAQVHGARTLSWRDFDRRADALARHLLDAGLQHQSKVAAYLYNGPEYLETYYAAFKAGLAPVNTNYRYVADELVYLFDNADAEAVVFHASFAPTVDRIRGQLPKVRSWIAVAEAGHPVPPFAADYDALVAQDTRRTQARWGRSGDDVLILYTGGTTGMPKGVMWRQDDLFNVLGGGGNLLMDIPPLSTIAEAGERARASDPGAMIAAAPLMHGTAQFTGMMTLTTGGTVACLPSKHFDAHEFWSEAERLKATGAAIVGMAFAAPLLEALDRNPGRWDLSALGRLGSSGTVWSMENKQGLLKHLPDCVIFDSFGSSEAVGMGASSSSAGAMAETAKFMVGASSAVFTEDGRRVEPGSGERGLVAVSGFLPVGYYKDPEKTARTFREFEGRRWSVPGDFATVEADGSLRLLGRGSQVVNTGGEKVFPEEVEEALKRYPGVRDAAVVGVPDPRFGERICAVVDYAGEATPTLADLSAHVREHLAGYKAPRELVLAPITRAANGKLDYKGVRALALERLGLAP